MSDAWEGARITHVPVSLFDDGETLHFFLFVVVVSFSARPRARDTVLPNEDLFVTPGGRCSEDERHHDGIPSLTLLRRIWAILLRGPYFYFDILLTTSIYLGTFVGPGGKFTRSSDLGTIFCRPPSRTVKIRLPDNLTFISLGASQS